MRRQHLHIRRWHRRGTTRQRVEKGDLRALRQFHPVAFKHDPGGMHTADRAQQQSGSTGTERQVTLRQFVDERDDVIGDAITTRGIDHLERVACPNDQFGRQRIAGGACRDLRAGPDKGKTIVATDLAPVRHRDDEPEAVDERFIEFLDAEVARVGATEQTGRIDGGPAMTQRNQVFAGDAALVHQRKELVLQIGPAAVDFVEEDELGVPHCPGGAEIAETAVVIGNGDADEIVVVQQRRVVMTKALIERVGDPLGDECFRRAVRADQQHRGFERQGGKHDRVDGRPAMDAESRNEFDRTRRLLCTTRPTNRNCVWLRCPPTLRPCACRGDQSGSACRGW